jgi:hypothetical protein
LAAQSSTLVSQLRPEYPALHVQTYVPAAVPFAHVAPFMQGLSAQLFATVWHITPENPTGH